MKPPAFKPLIAIVLSIAFLGSNLCQALAANLPLKRSGVPSNPGISGAAKAGFQSNPPDLPATGSGLAGFSRQGVFLQESLQKAESGQPGQQDASKDLPAASKLVSAASEDFGTPGETPEESLASKAGEVFSGNQESSLPVPALEPALEEAQEVSLSNKKLFFEKEVLPLKNQLHFWALQRSKGNIAVAEDLTSITLIKAWEAMDRFQPLNLRGWLYTILAHTRIDEYNKTRLETVHVDDYESEEIFYAANKVKSSNHDMAERIAAKRDIRRAIGRLSKKLRQVIVLDYLYGYSLEEIGKILNISPEAAGVRVHRARKQLKEYLADYHRP